MSSYHPELWNPMWSVKTILIGLISFMNDDEITTGGVRATDAYREEKARESLEAVEGDEIAVGTFGEFLAR